MQITINKSAIQAINKAIQKSALETGELLRQEVVNAAVMPFENGDMQNNQTYVDQKEEGGRIVTQLITGSPQARRLYFNPQYNFRTDKNANAGGEWLDPWLNGNEKDFVENTLRERIKVNLK